MKLKITSTRVLRLWSVCSIVWAIVIIGQSSAHASLLAGTTMPTGSQATTEYQVGNCCVVAQAFTLTSAAFVETITVDMSGFGTDNFSLWVTNAIGPSATQANVLLEGTLTFPNTGGGVNAAAVSLSTPDFFLTPGSYYLVESATQASSSQGWVGPATPIATSLGAVGQSYDSCCVPGSSTDAAFAPGSTFTTLATGVPLGFQISGDPAGKIGGDPSPEPASFLSVVVMGSVGLLAWKSRRRAS